MYVRYILCVNEYTIRRLCMIILQPTLMLAIPDVLIYREHHYNCKKSTLSLLLFLFLANTNEKKNDNYILLSNLNSLLLNIFNRV